MPNAKTGALFGGPALNAFKVLPSRVNERAENKGLLNHCLPQALAIPTNLNQPASLLRCIQFLKKEVASAKISFRFLMTSAKPVSSTLLYYQKGKANWIVDQMYLMQQFEGVTRGRIFGRSAKRRRRLRASTETCTDDEVCTSLSDAWPLRRLFSSWRR